MSSSQRKTPVAVPTWLIPRCPLRVTLGQHSPVPQGRNSHLEFPPGVLTGIPTWNSYLEFSPGIFTWNSHLDTLSLSAFQVCQTPGASPCSLGEAGRSIPFLGAFWAGNCTCVGHRWRQLLDQQEFLACGPIPGLSK